MDQTNYYLYVLECADGSYYAGYTTDLDRRLNTHNKGKGAKYTRARLPVVLRYSRKYETKTEAMQAEYRFKQYTRSEKERIIEQAGGNRNEATKELCP